MVPSSRTHLSGQSTTTGRVVERLSAPAQAQCSRDAQQCQALHRKQLRLTFQPLVPLRRSLTASFEVLGHLHSPRSTGAPRTVPTDATARRLAETLDRALIRNSLAWLRQPEFSTLILVVNLSPASVLSQRFAPWLASQLQHRPDDRNRLMLQFSEPDLELSSDSLSAFGSAMTELQIPLAVRQFGINDDPLAVLSRLAIKQVELAPVRFDATGPEQEQLLALESLVGQLHAQQIKVVAGQIDSLEPLPLIWQAGVDFARGNGLQAARSRPILRCVCERVFAGPEATN